MPFYPDDCDTTSGTPHAGFVNLGGIIFDYKKIEFNGYYKGKIQNQQFSPQYSPFGSSILKGQIFPPKWIFNFRSCLLPEEDLIELLTIQAESQANFANRLSGGILLIDNWQQPFITTNVVVILPEDLFSDMIGPNEDLQIIYRVSFTAIEL